MHTHSQKKLITVGVIALVIGIGLGYGSARLFTHQAAPQFSRGNFTTGGNAGGMMRGGAFGGGLLTGTVAASDSGSLTLNTRDGSSHIVLVTPETTVSKSVNGALSDVSVGSTVIISGTTNRDGSVSASLIQIRPAAAPSAQ